MNRLAKQFISGRNIFSKKKRRIEKSKKTGQTNLVIKQKKAILAPRMDGIYPILTQGY